MTSAAPTAVLGTPSRPGFFARLDSWLHAMPHPSLVAEISSGHVAAARWGASRGALEAFAVEDLPGGSVMPSPVETNITQPEAVRQALRRIFSKVSHRGAPLALLIPDPALRVFVLPLENLPRKADDALPLLRWRLKKSVPFDVDETTVSWMRQAGRDGSLEVVAAIARHRIVREYEELLESVDVRPGVVLSSTLAVLPLLGSSGATLLARLCGTTLTTTVVFGESLCVYRSTELMGATRQFDPQLVLNEVFPAAAYFQDTWRREIDRAYLAGFGESSNLFRDALGRELNIAVESISTAPRANGLNSHGKDLLHQGLDGLAGWAMNGGS
ncbi:MAG: type IV pilus biogenesis protein PilM [Candidatus Acidiferrales bacterium]